MKLFQVGGYCTWGTTGWNLVQALIISTSADQQRNVLRESQKFELSLGLMYDIFIARMTFRIR